MQVIGFWPSIIYFEL